jgi:putative ABC transport system permease protein
MVTKNLLRQPVRAALTVVGISLGITTVVALGVIAAGLGQTASDLVRSGGADFMVAQEGAADLSFSVLPESTVREVAARPGVVRARGVLFDITRAGSNPFFFLSGTSAADLDAASLELVAGTGFSDSDTEVVLLGERAAADLEAGVGDTVVIQDRRLEVVGIYRSESLWEASGGVAPLVTVQEMVRAPGTVTVVFVTVADGADPATVGDDIIQTLDDVVVITGAGDYNQVDQGFEIIDAANAAISLLAVLIGGIGVMNTMIMSVFERTREIGVLRAVGWSGGRVMRMILVESLLLCLLGALVGVALGIGVTQLVLQAPAAQGFLSAAYEPVIFVRALLVGVVVALLGASYPAFRATRLTPMEALGYE